MFDRLFKKKEVNTSQVERIDLTSEDQLDELLSLSIEKPVLIFKHSTRCGISNMVLKRFENQLNKNESEVYYYFLDLLKYKSLSNLIANKFSVPHQSPQLIVLKNKKITDHSSHYGIMDIAV